MYCARAYFIISPRRPKNTSRVSESVMRQVSLVFETVKSEYVSSEVAAPFLLFCFLAPVAKALISPRSRVSTVTARSLSPTFTVRITSPSVENFKMCQLPFVRVPCFEFIFQIIGNAAGQNKCVPRAYSIHDPSLPTGFYLFFSFAAAL